jgi:hypothetical protein
MSASLFLAGGLARLPGRSSYDPSRRSPSAASADEKGFRHPGLSSAGASRRQRRALIVIRFYFPMY